MTLTIAIGPSFPIPALRGGAIPRMWHGLAREFVRLGHPTTIMARAFDTQAAEETLDGIRVLRWGGFDQSRSIRRDLIKDLFYALGLARRLPDADILVTNDFWLPVVAPYRGSRVGKVVINANRFPKKQYSMYGKAALIAASSCVVADAIKNQCPKLVSQTKVLPNTIDPAFFAEAVIPRNNALPQILYVGRIHPEKGIHLLIEACRLLDDRGICFSCRIVGPWEDSSGGGGLEYWERLRNLSNGLPVEMAGPVFDLSQLAGAYQNADLFCYPSVAEKGEAFGLAPLEAMASGVPAVVSQLKCFEDFIVSGTTGWFFDHRAADAPVCLATVLETALRDSGARQSVGRAARETALRFTIPVVARQYLEAFESLLP